MASLQISQLPLPCEDFSIEIHSTCFEAFLEASAEDAFRAKRLRKLARCRKPKHAAQLRALADILDPELTQQTPQTLASSRYMRDLRIRVIGAVWQLAARSHLALCRYDIAKPSWVLSPKAFRDATPIALKAKLRADLLRAAASIGFDGVPQISGFLIAFLHGEYTEFDDSRAHLHPHFHCLVSGDWIAVVEAMRAQRGYKPTAASLTPIRASRKLDDLPYALSYLLKSYWPAKWKGTVSGVGTKRRNRDHRRIPEPHHSEVLLWLHHARPSDLVLKMGLNQARGGFTMS
ncbi:hypothetical protein [Blastomonas fulva]|jgi:hypothetical protein|uniref:hypothetical protein n=1 Tax=Blastomonas fulva TaxID=1550728 RepID=UPI003D2857E0